MTLTKAKMNGKTTKTYSTREVIAMTGLSFRVLDYWLRTGAVILADDNTPGSGSPRRYSESEVEAIKRLADRYTAAQTEIDDIRSGKAWMDLVVA
jgi:DNA-binding transcriptional MerR regulator